MLRFSYEPMEAAWAKGSITDDVNQLEMFPTLIFNDPLADLARACVALLDTVHSPYLTYLECSWQSEPGEWRWRLEKQGRDLEIQIVWFDENPGQGSIQKEGQLEFRTRCALLKFAIQVKTQLRDIESELGAEEYRRRTHHPLPQDKLDQLTSLIRAEQLEEKRQRNRST